MSGPNRVSRFVAAFALALALVFALAAVASAVTPPTPDPTMSLATLKAKLDASGTVPAYMKTVVKGADVVQINLTIQALTDGPLILFNSTDPLLTQYGGIVAGMSGSPIYVHDDDTGHDEVIGALSYGDIFTLGNYGLATPIDQMIAIKTKYEPLVQTLSHPVATPSGVLDKVMLDTSGAAAPAATSNGIAVAKPLTSIRVLGGIPSSSRLFQRAAAKFAKFGVTLVSPPTGRTTSPELGDQTFSTPLVPGAALATMQSRGDVYFGAIGTVTYVDGSELLAYGHPDTDSGPANNYLQNAWIDGIWPSSVEPYKLGRLGALRGTITQDRGNGVMGEIGQFPAETTITAEATDTASGDSTSTTTFMPRSLLDSPDSSGSLTDVSSSELPVYAVSAAGLQLFDQSNTPGSAEITTTVVLRDTSDPDPSNQPTYTITIPNFISDDYDIPSAIVWDVDNALGSLQEVLSGGVYSYEIDSIDLQSKITPRQRWAEVVDVSSALPLHNGDNTVTVSLMAYGAAATQTVPVKLTIPAGVPTNGTLSAVGAGDGMDVFPTSDGTSSATVGGYWTSVSDVVKDLNSQVPGNFLVVRYSVANPAYSSSSSFDGFGMSSKRALSAAPVSRMISIVTSAPTGWATSGDAVESPVLIAASLDLPVMSYDGFDTLEGDVLDGPDDVGVITLYATPAGSSTESVIGTTTADPKDDTFSFDFDSFKVNTLLRINVLGGDGYLPTDTTLTVPVHCYMSLSSSASSVTHGKSVTLTTKLWPAANAGSKVTFEYYSHGWRKIATKTLAGGSAAKASTSWKVPKGSTKVRCRFLGSLYNAPTTSSVKTVKGN